MIICPTCREEIDGDSHFCDQCGQALLYCNQCGHVGIGRRCTRCGGLMVAPSDQNGSNNPAMSASLQADPDTASARKPAGALLLVLGGLALVFLYHGSIGLFRFLLGGGAGGLVHPADPAD